MITKVQLSIPGSGEYDNTGAFLALCNDHDENVWHWASNPCPACEEYNSGREEIKELKRKLRQKNKDIKLLRYELREEKIKHGMTQLETSEILALREKVIKEVGDKLA